MVRDILAGADRVFHAAGSVIGYAGIVVLVAMMLLTVTDVTLRALFNWPVPGCVELTQLMLVVLSFFTLVFCTTRMSHVKVDILAEWFSPGAWSIIESVFLVFSLVLYWFISWYNFREGESLRLGFVTTDILEIPLHPFYFLIGLGSGVVGLLLLAKLFEKILGVSQE